MAAASLRMLLAIYTGEWMTASLYLFAIAVFFAIAAAFHYGTFYRITSERLQIASGLWTARWRQLPLDQIVSVRMKQELLHRWLHLGSVEVSLKEGEPVLIKGVPDPEWITQRIERTIGRHGTSLAAL
jgi:uncharacterized membrane protein YdbT with pleckstrin-like domain